MDIERVLLYLLIRVQPGGSARLVHDIRCSRVSEPEDLARSMLRIVRDTEPDAEFKIVEVARIAGTEGMIRSRTLDW